MENKRRGDLEPHDRDREILNTIEHTTYMIAKAKVISHGANAIRYSVDKDKAEIV